MNNFDDVACVLIGCWNFDGKHTFIPTSRGVLDKGLQIAIDKGAFPYLKGQLHFVDGSARIECEELESILDAAQEINVTKGPNPSYQRTEINVSVDLLHEYLRELGVTEEQAAQWGSTLRGAVEEVLATLDETEAA